MQTDTSKLISYWLRHKPQEAGLQVDEWGWTKLDRVIAALAQNNIEMMIDEIVALNQSFDKIRWEIDLENNKIRATHGHSFPINIDEKTEKPPEILYHGTTASSLIKILKEGLKPMNRQYVHLSEEAKTAKKVAQRRGKPIIIEIETDLLVKNGWPFYKTSENVWLTNAIPPNYLSFIPWWPIKEKDVFFKNELIREIGNRRNHFLYAHLKDLELVWNTGASDDTLFADKKTGKHYVIHLTFTKMSQEIEGFPLIQTYNSFEDWLENGFGSDQEDYYY